MKVMRVGVDLAKNVFEVHGVDDREQPVWRRSLKRATWLRELVKRVEPGAEIGLEACAGAHHWARALRTQGYRVKLMAPQFVKPYVKSNKTDRNDAAAICEAMSRPSMREGLTKPDPPLGSQRANSPSWSRANRRDSKTGYT